MRSLLECLTPWRFHRRVRQEAANLIDAYGAQAYTVARDRARSVPRAARGNRDRFWTAVAIRIADAEGREIGVTGADGFLRGK